MPALVVCSAYVFGYATGKPIYLIESCLQITMAKEEGTKTVVVGGSNDVQQQYCGTVGGQSTDFATIDTEIKVCMPEIVIY